MQPKKNIALCPIDLVVPSRFKITSKALKILCLTVVAAAPGPAPPAKNHFGVQTGQFITDL